MTQEPPAPGPSGQPIIAGAGVGKTEEELWRYTIRKLGGGITDVELTSRGDIDPLTHKPFPEGETHQDDCIEDAKRWYSYRVGFKKIIQIQVRNNQSAYLMPTECTEVITVHLPSYQLPTLDADQFSYTYFSLLFGQWTNPMVMPLPYSDLVQRLQYLEMVGRIFSSDRDWVWHAETRTLEILPAPAALGSYGWQGTMAAPALVTIWSQNVDPRYLDAMHLDFFRRKLMIEAMKRLAVIRTKFDSVTMMGTDRSMNGADLQANAEGAEEKLERDIMNWKRALPIIMG